MLHLLSVQVDFGRLLHFISTLIQSNRYIKMILRNKKQAKKQHVFNHAYQILETLTYLLHCIPTYKHVYDVGKEETKVKKESKQIFQHNLDAFAFSFRHPVFYHPISDRSMFVNLTRIQNAAAWVKCISMKFQNCTYIILDALHKQADESCRYVIFSFSVVHKILFVFGGKHMQFIYHCYFMERMESLVNVIRCVKYRIQPTITILHS